MEQGDVGVTGQFIQKLPSAALVQAGMSQEPPADLELVPAPWAPPPSANAIGHFPCISFAPCVWASSTRLLPRWQCSRAAGAGEHRCRLRVADQGKSV